MINDLRRTFELLLKQQKHANKWNSKTPIAKLWDVCQQGMKNEVKRWIALTDLLEYHKFINKDHLTFEGAGLFLFNDQFASRFIETVKENEKVRRQTFRWSKDESEWRFLWNLSDLGGDSSSESDEELDDEQGFFNSVFKHNIK